jgi:prepilin-type N-terminal cleavage/methylation domain-containing protein
MLTRHLKRTCGFTLVELLIVIVAVSYNELVVYF